MTRQVPLVNYLVLGEEPHLVVLVCRGCSAHYFDRRNACASCGGSSFASEVVSNSGELRTFSIVEMAAPGVRVPFVAAVVDCSGVSVRANIVNVPPDPQHVLLGMRVQLATCSIGMDADGVEAIGFGYEPASLQPA